MNILKKTTLAAVVTAATCLSHAAVSISVDAEGITAAGGTSMSSGVAVLVASTGNSTFEALGAGQLATGDDQVLAVWDLSSVSVSSDSFALLASSIAYEGDLGAEDPIGLYWYPNLAFNGGSPSPSGSEVYGFYTDTTGETYGDAWELPTGGALLHSLKFFVQSASQLVEMGNIPDFIGQAGFTVGSSVAAAQAAASGTSSEATAGTVSLTFSGASSAPGGEVVVQRRLKGDSLWEIVGALSGDSFDDDTIGRGKEYEYQVLAINGYGSASSSVIAAAKTFRSNLINISTRGLFGGGDNIMIAGYAVTGGENIDVLARALGPQLTVRDAALTDVSPNPSSGLYSFDDTGLVTHAVNDNWADEIGADAMNAFFVEVGADALASGSTDSAMVAALAPNTTYTVLASDSSPEEELGIVEIYDFGNGVQEIQDAVKRLVNLSTRAKIGSGAGIMIGGFAVSGQADITVLIRGVGPGLSLISDLAPESLLGDPQIVLYKIAEDGVSVIGQNNNWQDDDEAGIISAITEAGGFQFDSGSTDAAMIVTLDPGNYTAFIQGADGSDVGIGLFELYELGR